MIIWLIGLSGVGKTTIGREVWQQWREQDPSKGARDAHEADAQLEPRSIPDVGKHLRCQALSCDAPCGFSTVGEVVLGPPTSCTARVHVMHFGESSVALDS